MSVFVVVVTYNSGHEWLDQCLGSLRLSKVPLQCIVIDNASNDDSVEYIRANYPEVELITSSENLGFAKANNLGISKALAAGAEHVFLLNHDAWFVGDCLEQLVKLQQQSPEFGILSPVHLNGSGERLDWNFTKYISSCHDEGRQLYTQLIKGEPLHAIYQVDFVNAAAWLISRACLLQVGLFDTELFVHYGEDTHYAQRVNYHQFKIGVVPRCFIHHDREERSGKAVTTVFNQNNELLSFILDLSNILKAEDQSLIRCYLRNRVKLTLLALVTLNFSEFRQQFAVYKRMHVLLPTISRRRQLNSKTAIWPAD